ncbi:LuxR C-terminal-related transcriptional regulator, partial [Eudoraea sp.]|uniref:helix-turn-helix transcriptional regulator n=1 Tax=Eudoraea sp. TaxID=1979955 RepID=UPI003C78F0F5
ITMLDIASSSHLDCQLVEINLLLSLALQKMGQEEASMEKLKAAVVLAKKLGFIRPFVEAGKSAMVLLNSLKEKGVAIDFIDEIHQLIIKVSDKKDTALHENIEVSEKVILTERELETLELLASGLRNKEIANALFVSEGTIKKHVYNMGQKFETSSRVDLLNRTRQLGLIQ